MLVLPSKIDAVTVFRSGALVTRVAELPAGAPARVRLDGLPLALDDGSIEVGAQGGVVATDVKIALALPEHEDATRPAVDEALRAAERAEREAKAQLAQINRELEWYGGLGLAARPDGEEGKPPPEAPFEARPLARQRVLRPPGALRPPPVDRHGERRGVVQ